MKIKSVKQILSAALALMIALVAVGVHASAAADKIRYVALGDSVPSGYALRNPNKENYARLFSGLLAENGIENLLLNRSREGITATELLEDLKTAEVVSALCGAALVTLHIGGNNILQAVAGIAKETAEELGITAAIEKGEAAQWIRLITKIKNLRFTDEQKAVLMAEVEVFSSELSQAVALIREAAPEALLIVSTIYNPVPAVLAVSKDTDELITAMNEVIWAGQADYAVADTYTAFKESEIPVINMNFTSFTAPLSFDIHPNAAGHALMATLHYDLFASISGRPERDGSASDAAAEERDGVPRWLLPCLVCLVAAAVVGGAVVFARWRRKKSL